jgi:MFS family permease
VSRPETLPFIWLCQIKTNTASHSYDQGVLSGLLENPSFREQFGDPDDVITGITVASYCLGDLFGCLISFAVGDILGRRHMIWLAMGLIIVGASLQTSAHTLAHLIVGRIITGLGTGIDSSTVPMYQSELSKREWRGRLVSWEILFIGIGIVIVRASSDCLQPSVKLTNMPYRLTGSISAFRSWTVQPRGAHQSQFSSSSPSP